MKRIIFLIIALLPFIACAQNNIKKTASIAYTNGAPTFTPNISYSTELAVDTVTSNLYWWSRNATAWTKYPRGVDVIAGSVVPSYTPRDNQALFAINADNELYYYTGATWIQIGGSGGGGVYGGSGTTGAAVTTVTIDSILAFSNTSGDPARFSVLIGDTGGTYAEAKIDTARLTYFDVGGTNGYYLGPDGLKLRTASPDRAIIDGLDARYASDYSGTYSDRSLIDKGYADATYTATGDVSGTSGQVALFTGTNTVGGSANLTYTSPSLLMGGSSPAATIADAAASSATSGGLLSLASYDNAANVFGDRLGSITFRGQTNGSGGTGPGARIDAYAFGTWSASSHPTALTFFTTSPSATSGTERFRIYANTARLRSATSLGFDNANNTILIYSFLPTADTAMELSTSQGGEFRFGGKIGFSGISRVYTTNQNDVFLGPYTYFSVTASGANIDFTGMLRSSVINMNRVVTFYNNGGSGAQLNDLIFKHESASSSAANRCYLPGEVDLIVGPYEAVSFVYDVTLSRWVPYSQSRTGTGDDWGAQAVVTTEVLSGDGTSGDPLTIAQGGATTGQVLKWNGSAWVADDDEVGSGGGGSIPGTLRPATLTAKTDNWNPSGYSTTAEQLIEVVGDGSFRCITGMEAATRDGVRKTLQNVGTNCFIVAKKHTDSDADNRFDIKKDVILTPGMAVTFRYDSITAFWKLLSTSTSEDTYMHSVLASLKSNTGTSTSGDNESWLFTANSGVLSQASAASGSLIRYISYSTNTTLGWPFTSTKRAVIYVDDDVSYLRMHVYLATGTTLSTGSESYEIRIGFMATVDSAYAEGAYINYNHAENSGGWVLKTNDGTTTNSVNAGSAISTSTRYDLELIYYPYGEVVAFVDGSRYVSSSNIPSLVGAIPFVMLDKDSGTSSRTLSLYNFDVQAFNVSQ